MKRIIFLAAFALSTAAHADQWTGQDKLKHIAAGAAISSEITVVSGSETVGFCEGVGAGARKEFLDAGGTGQASFKDFAATALGAYVGAKIGGLVITPKGVSYSVKLNLF